MSLKFSERSYGGKTFRPTPSCLWENSPALLTMLTFWGAASTKERQLEAHHDFFKSLQEKSSISENGLNQSIADFLNSQNEILLHEANENELQSGYESLNFFQHQGMFYLAQVGQPHVILIREQTALPLHSSQDLNIVKKSPWHLGSPLPATLMGVEEPCPSPFFKGFPLYEGDKVVLLSRSLVEWPTYPLGEISLDSLSLHLAKQSENQPFWLGLIEV